MADQAYGAAQVSRRCAHRSALVDGAEIGHEHSPTGLQWRPASSDRSIAGLAMELRILR